MLKKLLNCPYERVECAKKHTLFFAFSEERKLLDDERVLFVQLNWGKDVREGRFLLRKEVSAGQMPELFNIVPPERVCIWKLYVQKFYWT